ncbi:capsular polysaccharide synthesis protein [Hoeflea marina]|uniref:Capsular polysaccharide synthesis protein n=1 Tax=Hoeflea marina TaxID=274592 RepID=A0A317PBY1_9HYPH|nr:capsular polysaccharide synthesis protein [Hoeflea marina]PWV95267.1 capsular polysaccharide synthesis protein [Hoeflea marina]
MRTDWIKRLWRQPLWRPLRDRPGSAAPETGTACSAIPRTIWIYWDSGWDQAPALSQDARVSWRVNNPGWTLRDIDLPEAERLLGPDWRRHDLPETMTPTALSNLVRLSLLQRFGGVWADATTFCVTPLSQWIDVHAAGGFFAFEKPGQDRALATWFLAAEPGNLIVERWLDASWEYWNGRDAQDEFHWVHRRFAILLEKDREFRDAWAMVNHISARHRLHLSPGHASLDEPPVAADREAVAKRIAPVCKLTNRRLPAPPGSLGQYLQQILKKPVGKR